MILPIYIYPDVLQFDTLMEVINLSVYKDLLTQTVIAYSARKYMNIDFDLSCIVMETESFWEIVQKINI